MEGKRVGDFDCGWRFVRQAVTPEIQEKCCHVVFLEHHALQAVHNVAQTTEVSRRVVVLLLKEDRIEWGRGHFEGCIQFVINKLLDLTSKHMTQKLLSSDFLNANGQ